MELLSQRDIFILKIAACSATALLSANYLQQYLTPAIEPLIPQSPKSAITAKIDVAIPPTRSINKMLEQMNKQCVVFYGSQTGTAERLAYQFAKDIECRLSLRCLVADLEDYDYEDLLNLRADKIAVFLLATYGEGEPTDNAVTLNHFLERDNDLSRSDKVSLSYAGFGLGNSSYQLYNEMIKRLDRRLTSSGARRIGHIGLGDDGNGALEEDFATWKINIISHLARHFDCEQRIDVYKPAFEVARTGHEITEDTFLGEPNKRHLRNKIRGPYTLLNPYIAPINSARQICAGGSRSFLHIEFDLSASTLTYEAGDHLSVRPINSELEVRRFLRIFGLIDSQNTEIKIASLDASVRVPVPELTTYVALIRYYLDICAPVSRRLLAVLADFAPSEGARSRLEKLSSNTAEFRTIVTAKCLNIAQVLQYYGGDLTWDDVPFSAILECIPVMKARHYSISSSPLVSRKTVSITTVVEANHPPGSVEEFKGVATNYLLALSAPFCGDAGFEMKTHHTTRPRDRQSQHAALVSIRRSRFKLPRDASIPVIMIGPGTGIAPFRGFVQTRYYQHKQGKNVGRTILFYGCRSSDEDFLYEDEWRRLAKEMTPAPFSMYTAFSRDPTTPKTYVQDLFLNHSKELRHLILFEHARVYVCGNAQRMARDVYNTMAEVLAGDQYFADNTEGSLQFLRDMKARGCWSEDVW